MSFMDLFGQKAEMICLLDQNVFGTLVREVPVPGEPEYVNLEYIPLGSSAIKMMFPWLIRRSIVKTQEPILRKNIYYTSAPNQLLKGVEPKTVYAFADSKSSIIKRILGEILEEVERLRNEKQRDRLQISQLQQEVSDLKEGAAKTIAKSRSLSEKQSSISSVTQTDDSLFKNW